MTTIEVINVEHKSSGSDISPQSDYWKALYLDTQITAYQTGTRSLGFEPVGTLYDVTAKIKAKPYLATPVAEREYTAEKSRACKECKKKTPTPGPHVEVLENDDGSTREVSCVDGRIITAAPRLYADMRERDETPDEYRARIAADIAANPDKYYQRGTIVRLQQEEIDGANDTWALAKQIRDSQLENRWPRNPDACRNYNRYCPYWIVCTGQASINDTTKFRHVPPTFTEEEDDGKKRLPILSVSSMKEYRACNRRYYFSSELRLRSIEDALELRYGTVWHIGLEVWWKRVNLDAAITAMREAYAKHAIDWVDAIRLEELLRGYDARWRNEPLRVRGVEVPFRTALVNPKTGAESKTWELGGRIDAIIEAPASAA